MEMSALAGWREYVQTRDAATLLRILHPEVVFESPIGHTPQRGRAVTFRYLSSAVAVLGGPGFQFTGEWRNAHGAVLELETEIDGIRINGVDLITLDADGCLITRFKVMIRPLEAIKLLHRLMGGQLARTAN